MQTIHLGKQTHRATRMIFQEPQEQVRQKSSLGPNLSPALYLLEHAHFHLSQQSGARPRMTLLWRVTSMSMVYISLGESKIIKFMDFKMLQIVNIDTWRSDILKLTLFSVFTEQLLAHAYFKNLLLLLFCLCNHIKMQSTLCVI